VVKWKKLTNIASLGVRIEHAARAVLRKSWNSWRFTIVDRATWHERLTFIHVKEQPLSGSRSYASLP
jgi:hypothetical protein